MEAKAAQSVNDQEPSCSLQRISDAIKVTDGMATAAASQRRSKSPSINCDWNGQEHLKSQFVSQTVTASCTGNSGLLSPIIFQPAEPELWSFSRSRQHKLADSLFYWRKLGTWCLLIQGTNSWQVPGCPSTFGCVCKFCWYCFMLVQFKATPLRSAHHWRCNFGMGEGKHRRKGLVCTNSLICFTFTSEHGIC